MITPADIRKPKNVSGFAHVGLVAGPSRANNRPYFQAYENGGRRGDWKGPARLTAHEAAQDYCDKVNGKQIAHAAKLNTAGHQAQRPPLPRDEEVEHALGVLRDARAQREGKQGFVYLIIEEHPGGALKFAKVGYSTNPRARVAELQTGNPRPLRLHMMKPGTIEDEAAIHQKFIRENVLQEWFRITPELLFEWDAEHYVEEDAA